jgi:hypothetical protein
MTIAMRLVRGKNLTYHLRLVELLGELGKTERAPLCRYCGLCIHRSCGRQRLWGRWAWAWRMARRSKK